MKTFVLILILLFTLAFPILAQQWEWVKVDVVNYPILCASSTEIDPQTVYVGTAGAGMFRTYNSGRTWRPINEGADGSHVTDILVLREDPYELFAIYRQGDNHRGLHHSVDGGNSWEIFDSAIDLKTLTVRQGDGNILYAGIKNAGVYKSTDKGKNWVISNAGIEYYSPYILNVFSANRNRVLTAVSRFDQGYGLFQSLDGGGYWSKQNEGLPLAYDYPPYTECILMDYSEPLIMYLGTSDNGLSAFHSVSTTFLYKSFSGGNSWTNLGRNIEDKEIMSLALDPNNPNIIFAGTKKDGLWFSQNAGGLWNKINIGASLNDIKTIVFAGEEGENVFIGSKEGLFQGKKIQSINEINNDDLICSPNPFFTSNYIRYNAPNAGKFELRIYDLSGRLVRRIEDGKIKQGWNLLEWDGRNEKGETVGSGVYYYQVRCDTAWATTRVLKVQYP
jgi:hypothetical protein